jgi:prepilin signal peptidase PulO-like enzyme (type II secretory pathway)
MLFTEIFIYIFLFCLGAIVGSFLNVVALRYNTGMSIVKGRSQCFSCGKTLKWYELVPVFSYFALGGRCSVCKSKISKQYVTVETITAILFAAAYYLTGLTFSLPFFLVFFSLLVVISIYDFKHKIIPDLWAYTFAALALIYAITMFLQDNFTWLDLAAGPLLALPFALLWLVSKGRWIGLGDAKLVLGLGAMLGFIYGISGIMLAFWIGAAFSVVLICIQKIAPKISKHKLGMKSEIPFGPFLILGALIILFLQIDFLSLKDIYEML